MITIREKIPSFREYHNFLNYRPDQTLFVDIETTGLSAETSWIYLIGLLLYRNGSWERIQLFSERPQEEPGILDAFASLAADCRTVVTWNGERFDLPFLEKKYSHYHSGNPLEGKQSIDLFHLFRNTFRFFSPAHLTLEATEEFLGYPKRNTPGGKKLIKTYQQYVSGLFPETLDTLLWHNQENLEGLCRILAFSPCFALFRGQFEIRDCHMDEESCLVEISPEEPFSFPAAASLPQLEASFGEAKIRCTFSPGQIQLSIPLYHGELLRFFPDPEHYYYLPVEDIAIHKSVASFVDPSYRKKATASNCYIRVSSHFLPQFDPGIEPSFRSSYSSREYYFSADELKKLSPETLKQYIQSILVHLRK